MTAYTKWKLAVVIVAGASATAAAALYVARNVKFTATDI